jgi:hypothetical protein
MEELRNAKGSYGIKQLRGRGEGGIIISNGLLMK